MEEIREKTDFTTRNIIVMGASAGGIPAINAVIQGLSHQMNIAVMVVLHVSRTSSATKIVNSFRKNTDLTCEVAEHGMRIQKGHLYVAPPEQQLMLAGSQLVLTRGPHENKYRPSIDVLFRSAAVNYRNRCIGIILTGLFEDGTSGMYAIKSCGGLCIIQDPVEAQFSDMPLSVLNKIKVDYQVRLAEIPGIIEDILERPLPPGKPVPRELQIEAEITENMMSDIENMKEIGEHSDFVCPDCGGNLWKLKEDPLQRYRCHTGHVFTQKLLGELQDEKIEESVWVSIRMLEEKENLLLLMANGGNQPDTAGNYSLYEDRLASIRKHIAKLKSLLMLLNADLQKSSPLSKS